MFTALKHIILRAISALLLFALLLPFAVKLDHVFENHEHVVCNSTIENHLHESEVDCDFFDYQINQLGYASAASFEQVLATDISTDTFFIPQTFVPSEQMVSSLRGPPSCA